MVKILPLKVLVWGLLSAEFLFLSGIESQDYFTNYLWAGAAIISLTIMIFLFADSYLLAGNRQSYIDNWENFSLESYFFYKIVNAVGASILCSFFIVLTVYFSALKLNYIVEFEVGNLIKQLILLQLLLVWCSVVLEYIILDSLKVAYISKIYGRKPSLFARLIGNLPCSPMKIIWGQRLAVISAPMIVILISKLV